MSSVAEPCAASQMPVVLLTETITASGWAYGTKFPAWAG